MLTQKDFDVKLLGTQEIQNPVPERDWVPENGGIVYPSSIRELDAYTAAGETIPHFRQAGATAKIFHDPAWTKAAILTAGGLCPGLNDVIKFLIRTLKRQYRVPLVYGIRYGYRGLVPQFHLEPMILTEDVVDGIHEIGGTILGSSRGRQDEKIMVDTLDRMNINVLFCVGGDGTLRCAHDIAGEVQRRNLKISVIGIPKTIDNDIGFIDKSFGFETAIYTSAHFVTAAHNEAEGAYNGIGLVKVMGRDSGFIAAAATLGNSHVNYCLVPENPFTLDGDGMKSLLPNLEDRLAERHHAVILVAEGAGQNLFETESARRDASGNKLHQDIGLLLKKRINEYFAAKNIEVNIKYFDPSYAIRSLPASGTDAVFCAMLAQNAVHAAMSGYTDVVIGHWHNDFTLVPIPLATRQRKKIDLTSPLWKSVRATVRM
ncbi:MAG: ATP-dependent 6-phosphofructokinase [Lentisphaeria bacterium]|nr:ATP-dependent 6-phosphofructokinase [Lentisphaeria bacterium]